MCTLVLYLQLYNSIQLLLTPLFELCNKLIKFSSLNNIMHFVFYCLLIKYEQKLFPFKNKCFFVNITHIFF